MACAYQKVNLQPDQHIPSRDLKRVHAVDPWRRQMLISSRRSFVLVVREGTEMRASGGLRLSGSTAGLIVVAAERCPAGDATRVQAARRSYRWWRPPTSGMATMAPSPGGMTGRGIGASLSKAK